MAETNQPTTQLNKEWLENFRKVDLADFKKALKTVTENGKTDPVIPSMKALKGDDDGVPNLPFGTPVPLAIGNLASDPGTHGESINKAVVDMVTLLDGILKSHVTLFDDIDDAIEETIDSLFKTQGESLDAVEGQKLVDIFEDVEDDLTTPANEEEGGGDDK
ncbi:type VII secretion system-associated protein [Streptomyces sp. NPDC019937]|uniref:type VII secretion system-associated protein n=1 Tax=Streptomyces sp. NPDC019937 TaxID=3154787 RepID=UPI0033EEC182